jgi:DNA polymerase-3 subunit alpha
MAALLTSVKNNKDTKPIYLNECRRLDIPVLPPDVNVSEADFAADGDSIRFGMAAVRGVGEGVVEAIVRARVEEGPFTDFRDFCAKVDGSVLNKRTIENLTLAGAFTGLGHTRKGLLGAYEPIIDAAQSTKKAKEAGQDSLFDGLGGDDPVVELDDGVEIGPEEFGKSRLLAAEREMLGLYVSDHPLFGAERLLEEQCDATMASLREKNDGDLVTVGGVLTGLVKKFTRKGDTYMTATLEDLTGAVEVVFWPTVYRVAHEVLSEDTVLLLTGRVEKRDEAVKLTANRVTEPDLSEVRGAPVHVRFEPGQCTPDAVARLRTVLGEHRGHVPVHLTVWLDAGSSTYQLGDDLRVTRHPGLFGELKMAFGPDAVRDGAPRSFSTD